jgi:hypothetical protein
MTSLESETGMDPGWINNGGLFIANNKVGVRIHRKCSYAVIIYQACPPPPSWKIKEKTEQKLSSITFVCNRYRKKSIQGAARH